MRACSVEAFDESIKLMGFDSLPQTFHQTLIIKIMQGIEPCAEDLARSVQMMEIGP